MDDSHARAIANKLKQLKSIKTLNLSGEYEQLLYLNIIISILDNEVGPPGIIAIISALMTSTTIEEIDIGCTLS